MLEEQLKELALIVKNDDLRKYAEPLYADDLGVNVMVIGLSVTLTKSLFSS